MRRIVAPVPLILVLVVGLVGLGASPDGALAAMGAQPAADAGQPIVEITKGCPKLRYIGREATFEITVANRGSGAAHDVVVTDVIAGEIEFKSADNKGVHEDNSIVWRLGNLAAGTSRTLKAVFHCNKIGKIRNVATVTYCAETKDECELEVKGIPAILLECVDDPDPIELNSNVTYTISVKNQGSAVGTNIVIECTLPPEQEHVSSTGPTKVGVKGKELAFAPLPTLAPKATAVYKVTVKGVAVGDVRFRVQLMSDQMKTSVMETESTHIYE